MKRHRTAAAVLALSLLLGWLLAREVGDFLAISFHEKSLPEEHYPGPVRLPAELSPLAPVAAIVLPAGASADDLYQAGANELAAALELRTGERPLTLEATERLPAGRLIRVGAGAPPPASGNPEAFALRAAGAELLIAGASRRGAPGDALVIGVWPLALLMAAHLTFSSFLSPAYVMLISLPLACFIGVPLILNLRRSPFAPLTAMNGPLLLGTALLLSVVAVRGPLYFWYRFWTGAGFRVLLITLGVAVFGWLLFAVYTSLRAAAGHRLAAALGQLLLALGAPLLVLGGLVQAVGLERSLTLLNDGLGALPLGLSRILGITTHLDIPLALPLYLMGAGALLIAGGALLAGVSRAGAAELPREHPQAPAPQPTAGV